MKRAWLILFLLIYYIPSFGLDGNGTAGNGYRGSLTEDFTFGPGDVYIDGELKIKTFTLTVAPGTSLIISDAGPLNVYDGGRIIAKGTQTSPIYFRAGNVRWGPVRLYNNTVSSEFEYCTFENGKSFSSLYPNGGVIWIYQSPNISISNCNFVSNSAMDYGTGSASGGAIYASSTFGLTINNCSFINNSALDGGAIYLFDARSEVVGCTFEGNIATKQDGRGGAIFVHAALNYEVLIDRCKIYSNTSNHRTGGIHFDTGSGGTVMNSLIYANNSIIGGGINMGTNTTTTPAPVNIVNCLIAENTPCDVAFRTSAGYSIRNTIIWGSDNSVMYNVEGHDGKDPLTSNLINCAVQGATDRNGMQIDIESTFINSFKLNSSNNEHDGPNFTNPLAHDYRINFISPCRDRGTFLGIPETPLGDFLGKARIGDCDIGAYEIQYSRWIGTSDDNWNTATNWEKDMFPSIGTGNIVITSGCMNYPTGLDDNDFVIDVSKFMIIEPGARITFNNLTNNGNLIIKSSSDNNSGSLILTGASEGDGIVTFERSLPYDGVNPLWHYVSSPIIATNTTSTKSFYPWDEIGGDWGGITESIESGRGYTVTANGSILFTGSLNTSELEILVTSPYSVPFQGSDYFTRPMETDRGYGGGGWNLLGNPYASAINVTKFIDANYNTDWHTSLFDPNYVALYLYNGSTYQYVTRGETGWETSWPNGVYLDANYIQAGQAFFVLAMNNGVRFNFSPSMQEHATGMPLLKSAKPEDRWPGIAINAKTENSESRTVIVFNGAMSLGLDPGYDIGFLSSASEMNVYTALVNDNGVIFAMQALPEDGATVNLIPIGIDFAKGGKVTFSAETEAFRNYNYWLEDRTTGIFTDLSVNSYSVDLPAQTFGTGRFFIHVTVGRNFRPQTSHCNLLKIHIWASQNREVYVQGATSDKAYLEVFDTQGHIIYERKLSESQFQSFIIPEITRGLYLVRLTDGVKTTITRLLFL